VCVCFCTERFKQTLVTALNKLVNEKADDWDQHLDAVAFACRVKEQASTKMSLFELMYEVKARLPTELQFDRQQDQDAVYDDEDAVATAILTSANTAIDLLKTTRASAKSNIEAAQAKQKRQYDIKRQKPRFGVGDCVLPYNRRRDTRKGGKPNLRYDGSYVVAEVLGKSVHRLTTLSGSPVKMLANSRDLKLAPTDGYASPSSSPSSSPLKSSTNSPQKKRTRRGHSPSVADDDLFWVTRLNFKEIDLEVVRHGKLNDKIIEAVNTMVAEHLGTPAQTTLIAQSPTGFAPCDIDRPMVAILHGIEHWVTVALRDGEVHYVDSLRPHQPLSTYVIYQLLQLFRYKVDDASGVKVLQ